MTGVWRSVLGICLGVALLGACGRNTTTSSATGTGGNSALPDFHPGGEPGVAATAVPTPVPDLPGAAARVLPLTIGDSRSLLLTNSAPSATKAFRVTLGTGSSTAAFRAVAPLGSSDVHVERLRQEQAALKGIPLPTLRYHLAQAPREVGDQEPFYVLLDTDPKARREAQITATLAARGDHCYVWVDPKGAKTEAEKQRLAARAQEIVSTFDGQIYGTDTRLFGQEPNPGVDGDARIHILISPAINDYGANATLGYYSRRDEYPADPNGAAVIRHSNAKELINIAAGIVLKGSPEDYLGTIAHEFQHMINFNQKVLVPHGQLGEDLWLDEGMAMYALEANGYGLRGGGQVLFAHVHAFQQEPGSYSLSDWDNNPQGIGYGPVYLFMVYLADRFGEGILKELVTSPAVGFGNLESKLEAHGARFSDVFADWATANVLDHQAGAAPRFTYHTIDMHGTYGGNALGGFSSTAVTGSGILEVSLRPCALLYGDLGKLEIPRIAVPPDVELESPLGLR